MILNYYLYHFGILVDSSLNDCGIVLRLVWYHFGIVLGSFGDHFVIILGSLWGHFWNHQRWPWGVDPPMSLVLSLEPLGGLTPLKYAQMFVVGAAAALGGGLTPPKQQQTFGGG